MPRHGWTTVANYLSIHEGVLRKYTNSNNFYVLPRYQINVVTSRFWELKLLKKRIMTRNGNEITLDIEKEVDIDDSNPKRPAAKTARYRYVASKPNPQGRWLIRYDSPHDDALEPGSANHHKYHHRRDATGPTEFVSILPDDGWPHVSDFLEEVVTTL